MGCDFFWRADEADLGVQKRAACFLESLARRRGWKYITYDGPISGYFMDVYELLGARAAWTTKHLVGVSIYDPKDLGLFGNHDLAARQTSFVFDNSDDSRHPLITLEPIPDFDQERYSWLRAHFDGTPMDPARGFYAVYQERGYERMSGDSISGFADLLAALKVNWIPSLDVADDYELFDEALRNSHRSEDWWSGTLDPDVDSRWR